MGASDQAETKEPVVLVKLRVPESLHARLKAKAERDDRSLHKTILHACRRCVDGVLAE